MDSNLSFEAANELIQTTTANAGTFINDFLLVIILVGLMLFFMFRSGRRGVVSLTMAVYAGFAIYTVFPFKETILASTVGSPLVSLTLTGVMLVSFIVIPYIILSRVVVTDFLGRSGIIFLLMISFLLTAMLLASAYHILPIRDFYAFTPVLDALFAPAEFFFWWFVSPLFALFMFAK
tara:strand:+ start:1008 stop:1541 length:534 start_codon:yes stop_codon:yes gene_type:complete